MGKQSQEAASADRSSAPANVKKELDHIPHTVNIDGARGSIEGSKFTDTNIEEPECQITAAKVKKEGSKRPGVKKELLQVEKASRAGLRDAPSVKVKKEVNNISAEGDIDGAHGSVKSEEWSDKAKEEAECRILSAKIRPKSRSFSV